MADSKQRIKVEGSEREAVAGARVVGPVSPDETVDVTVRLRPGSARRAGRVYNRGPRAAAAQPLTRDELHAQTSASPADVAAVEAFAHEHGITVLEASPEQRSVRLRGPASALQEAFGVSLQRVEHEGRTWRQRTDGVHVPPALAGIVTGVFGLDDRPQAKPHFRIAGPDGGAAVPLTAAAAPAAAPTSFTPPQVAQVYGFNPKAGAASQSIALIELGGGYRSQDLNQYAQSLGLPAFKVVPVSVAGAHNAPTGNPNSADGEVVLDIEVAASVAQGATIVVYFAPNTDAGFIQAVSAAVHDKVHKPNVVSISWGGPERSWTSQAMKAFDEVLQEANAVGVPVFVASGDDGASDGAPGLNVDFPASSPNAVGCGGTRLVAQNGKRGAETVWNDLPNGGAGGGGFSKVFPTPAFQKAVNHNTHRGVPDLAGNADPVSGYKIRVDGVSTVIGGTSAVAPLLAAVVALGNQQAKKGPGAFIQKVYAAGSPASTVFDVTQGNNGGQQAHVGWDACTGLGVPAGAGFFAGVWGAAPKAKKVKVPAMMGGGDGSAVPA
jgi:kumamolisin